MGLRWKAALVGALAKTVFWILLLIADPFGISSASDRVSEAIFLKFYSFIYPSLAPARARDDIVVILYDEANLPPEPKLSSDVKPTWPLPSVTHAALLSKLLAMEPKAVFFDILFDTKKVGDSGVSHALLDVIPKGSPPVFFGTYSLDNRRNLVSPLHSLPLLRAGEPFPAAPAYRAIVESKSPLYHYALAERGYLTAASALYNVGAPISNRITSSSPADMLVAWGSLLPFRHVRHPEAYRGCTIYFDDFSGRLKGFLHSIKLALLGSFTLDQDSDGGWNRIQPCEYHTTISANDILYPVNFSQERRLRHVISDSYVLIGAKIQGIEDFVISPVNGKLPGVYNHAMALDNLLSFRGRPIYTFKYSNLVQAFVIFVAFVIAHILFGDKEIVPKTRLDAAKGLFHRVGAWFAFVMITAIIVVVFLIFHIAPYNWGGVVGVAGVGFLSESYSHLMVMLIGRRRVLQER
jgi:hypothetical protein